jgi:hypothetical protein
VRRTDRQVVKSTKNGASAPFFRSSSRLGGLALAKGNAHGVHGALP